MYIKIFLQDHAERRDSAHNRAGLPVLFVPEIRTLSLGTVLLHPAPF